MRIIGLTGGIASGKSTVAKLLADHGIPVIDADQLAREVVQPGTSALKAIVELFGTDILSADGTLDRTLLGRHVFQDKELRKRLEEILHPAIGRLAEESLASLRSAGASAVIYMSPLLIEAGVTDRVDEIWVVYVNREIQLARLMERDGITREDAERKVASQMPMEAKKTYGKVIIDNNGSLEELIEEVERIFQQEFQIKSSP